MAKHWISDMQDPRTILAVGVAVMVLGSSTALMLINGSLETVWAAVWLVVSVAQFVWAIKRYLSWRNQPRQ